MNAHQQLPDNLPEVLTRGVEQILPGAATLAEKMQTGKIRVYLGIDPTGSLLTLGHSVVLRKLQQFADLGHEVILLVGNGTVRIGDPTGRDSTRPVLTDEAIAENFHTWQEQAAKILNFDKIILKYNGDWLDRLSYADIVRLLAQTTVQQLLERDMFQERFKNQLPIHGHEIIYPLLQGYDSVQLDVDLEIGGSDQLFNMMMGRQLLSSMKAKEKWVLTTPIINGTDGRKMSKSYGNFIALTDAPADMYGKLMSIRDNEIIPYFTLLTDVALEEISAMENQMAAGENPMAFKKFLAHTITRMYHDKDAADQAQAGFVQTVQEKSIPEEVPEVFLDSQPSTLLEVCRQCLPTESNAQLKRLIEQGAVTLFPSGEKVLDPSQEFSPADLETIKIGKRQYFTIKTRSS